MFFNLDQVFLQVTCIGNTDIINGNDSAFEVAIVYGFRLK